jgi:hypothetical protein
MREPVNRFPDFVAHVVRSLKVLCLAMGKLRIAQFLARAGLHLGTTTVARMLASPTRPRPAKHEMHHRAVRSTRPNQIWNVDLTTIPTAGGFWVPWVPWVVPATWHPPALRGRPTVWQHLGYRAAHADQEERGAASHSRAIGSDSMSSWS